MMDITVKINHEQVVDAISLDLDAVSLALDLLGSIDDDDLIQEVITYISKCKNASIRSDVFESIRTK